MDYLDLYLIHSPNTGLRWSGVKGEQTDPPLFFFDGAHTKDPSGRSTYWDLWENCTSMKCDNTNPCFKPPDNDQQHVNTKGYKRLICLQTFTDISKVIILNIIRIIYTHTHTEKTAYERILFTPRPNPCMYFVVICVSLQEKLWRRGMP